MTPGLMCIAGLRNEREADHFSWSSISRVLMIQRCLCQCQFPTIRRRETLVFPGNLNINSGAQPGWADLTGGRPL